MNCSLWDWPGSQTQPLAPLALQETQLLQYIRLGSGAIRQALRDVDFILLNNITKTDNSLIFCLRMKCEDNLTTSRSMLRGFVPHTQLVPYPHIIIDNSFLTMLWYMRVYGCSSSTLILTSVPVLSTSDNSITEAICRCPLTTSCVLLTLTAGSCCEWF